jgi:type II secretory ATPase GspE/PulE/Tfp pilus assembly ATPase PilB-like protein
MKVNVSGAQDGRFSIKLSDVEIEIRSSIVPSTYEDSIVLRILDPKGISVELESLGMHPRLLEVIQREINKPNGMLLNTGPTGSGKTASLYAFLRSKYSPDIKILTIENPIEYHMKGIVQTQTDPKKNYTFAAGLKAALRQDPDVIMVGEIRDEETASIALNAALTGHIVFSTLHTNNAAGTYPRLIDLGINPKTLTSGLTVSMAQRLVRKLCVNCKVEQDLSEEQKKLVEHVAGTVNDKSYLEGVQMEKHFTAPGCAQCHSGYKGRLGLYEAILSDSAVEQVVINNPSEREIWAAAAPQNILNMKQDALLKILNGTTSFEEVQRVIDIETDY